MCTLINSACLPGSNIGSICCLPAQHGCMCEHELFYDMHVCHVHELFYDMVVLLYYEADVGCTCPQCAWHAFAEMKETLEAAKNMASQYVRQDEHAGTGNEESEYEETLDEDGQTDEAGQDEDAAEDVEDGNKTEL
jgi:hypothetical protein